MKILLPYFGFKINDVNTVGGIENFTRGIYNNYENVIPLDLSYLASEYKSRELIKKCNQLIKLKSLENNVDIIISNRLKGMFCGSGMLDSTIPIIHIEHTNSPMLNCLRWFRNIKKYNHSIFLVNPFQRNYYDHLAKRINEDLIKFDGFVEPSFLFGEKPKIITNPEFDCVTIGRCNPRTKMPFRLKQLLSDTDFKTLVMTNPKSHQIDSKDERCHRYLNKNKHWDNCLYDLPHSEVLKNLSNAKTYFMTWEDETFGITGLEALSRGLPIILNTRMSDDRKPTKKQNYKFPLHASNIIPVDTRHCVNIMLNSSQELIDAIKNFKNINRQEIQDMTWEKYTKQRWKSLLDNAIDKTINNFKLDRNRLNI